MQLFLATDAKLLKLPQNVLDLLPPGGSGERSVEAILACHSLSLISNDRALRAENTKGVIKCRHWESRTLKTRSSLTLAQCRTSIGVCEQEESQGRREELPLQTFSVVCNCVECGWECSGGRGSTSLMCSLVPVFVFCLSPNASFSKCSGNQCAVSRTAATERFVYALKWETSGDADFSPMTLWCKPGGMTVAWYVCMNGWIVLLVSDAWLTCMRSNIYLN